MSAYRVEVIIPPGLLFAELGLHRAPDGAVEFDVAPLLRICEASGIPPEHLTDQAEDNTAAIIVAWYGQAREHGEPPDPVADDLIAEAQLEDERGGGLSHQPGRA